MNHFKNVVFIVMAMLVLPQSSMAQQKNPIEKVKNFAQSLEDNTQKAINAIQASLNSMETAEREFNELISLLNDAVSNLDKKSEIWQYVDQLLVEYEKNAKEASYGGDPMLWEIAKRWQEKIDILAANREEIFRFGEKNKNLIQKVVKTKKLVLHLIMLDDATAVTQAMSELVADMSDMH